MGDPRILDYGPGRVLDVLGYGSHVFLWVRGGGGGESNVQGCRVNT